MGTHPNCPSTVAGSGQTLDGWLAGHPQALGKGTAEHFHSVDLPFLFKVNVRAQLRIHSCSSSGPSPAVESLPHVVVLAAAAKALCTQHSTAQRSTAQHNAAQHSTACAAWQSCIRVLISGCVSAAGQVLSVDTALSIQSHPDKELAARLHAERPEASRPLPHTRSVMLKLLFAVSNGNQRSAMDDARCFRSSAVFRRSV